MSDQRPEWMPSEREFIGAIDLDSYLPGKTDFPNTIKVVRRTGLRAQIAVLKKITAQFCHYCAHGLEVVSHPTALGAFHVDDDGLFRDCESFEAITDEIAALRKELGA